MYIEFPAFGGNHQCSEHATHPLARPVGRLPLALLLAGMGLARRRFAADTRLNAPSDASNCGFQVQLRH